MCNRNIYQMIKKIKKMLFLKLFTVFVILLSIQALSLSQTNPLGVVSYDANKISEVKQSYNAGKKEFFTAVNKFKRDADKALNAGPFSVMDKTQSPPSGDKHDYMSMGKYWWPDKSKPDGKPYIRRDGEGNPETKGIKDAENLDNMVSSVVTLALAYYFTGYEPYAAYASKLMHVWFMNPETKMNPNLNYAQSIPGRSDGRGAGIIDAHGLPELLDAVGLISSSASWSANDSAQLKKWFEEYLTWLIESKNGKDEAKAKNNHGSWYDVQVASIATFVGKKDIAEKIIKEAMSRRIAYQIESDGKQPEELTRTNSLSYSMFNLEALFHLAQIGEGFGIDLWDYKTEDGRGIQTALDFVLPYLNGDQRWPFEQITSFKTEKSYPLLYVAALKYKDEKYRKAYENIPGIDQKKQLINILF
jgi:hypothetical protein